MNRTVGSEVDKMLLRAWATFGVPSSTNTIDESKEGLIDPEALLVITAAFGQDIRLLSDVAVWASLHSDLLIHGKILSCTKRLSPHRLRSLVKALRGAELCALPPKVMQALGGKVSPAAAPSPRAGKIAPLPVVAGRTRMLFNRLLYGAAARADIISVLQLPERPRSGKELAQLLAVNPSTVSRVLADLQTCQQLDRKGRFTTEQNDAPGMLISATSIEHLPEIVDAAEVKDQRLRMAMLPAADPATDGFGYLLTKQFARAPTH